MTHPFLSHPRERASLTLSIPPLPSFLNISTSPHSASCKLSSFVCKLDKAEGEQVRHTAHTLPSIVLCFCSILEAKELSFGGGGSVYHSVQGHFEWHASLLVENVPCLSMSCLLCPRQWPQSSLDVFMSVLIVSSLPLSFALEIFPFNLIVFVCYPSTRNKDVSVCCVNMQTSPRILMVTYLFIFFLLSSSPLVTSTREKYLPVSLLVKRSSAQKHTHDWTEERKRGEGCFANFLSTLSTHTVCMLVHLSPAQLWKVTSKHEEEEEEAEVVVVVGDYDDDEHQPRRQPEDV